MSDSLAIEKSACSDGVHRSIILEREESKWVGPKREMEA